MLLSHSIKEFPLYFISFKFVLGNLIIYMLITFLFYRVTDLRFNAINIVEEIVLHYCQNYSVELDYLLFVNIVGVKYAPFIQKC